MTLEEIWRIREEEVYPSLFGGTSRGIFTLTQVEFRDRFGQTDVDPRWLFLGVFEFAPTRKRPFWVYVTSGHSNPWDDAPGVYAPNRPSGTGVEFLLATTEQGEWAIREVLNLLAFDLLLRTNRFAGKPPLADGDRIPLRAPINGEPTCVLRNFLISSVGETWPGFNLPSGIVRFLSLVGISDAEVQFAKTAGSNVLAAILNAEGYLVTDTRRQSL
ncbi:suppressor of fused domain protein [Bradyrhizobium roseum]|uniref:suppressor of fused domain protein n=1 Tax=Bradyrhizobium roseum TaxID=3056648 RepID=UPI002634F849|nr:suppressor of fused domain protein [Bradyrhizobium roseus]WKA31717.1 suppressor of fused domain protein [Bradyrhizobium roseus]